MRTLRLIMFLLLPAVFVACNTDTETAPIPIEIEALVENFVAIETRSTLDGVEWADVREFFMYIENPADPAYSYQLIMSVNGSVWAAKDLDTKEVKKIYFKNQTDPVRIKAVYWNDASFKSFVQNRVSNRWTSPFNILLSKTITPRVQDVASNDPIIVNKVIVPKDDCPDGFLKLNFKHLFARVKVTLAFDFKTTRNHYYDIYSPISNFMVDGLVVWEYIARYPNWIICSDVITIPDGYPKSTIDCEREQSWDGLEGITKYAFMALPQPVSNGSFKISFDFEGRKYVWTCQEENLNLYGNTLYDIKLYIDTSTPSGAPKVIGKIVKGK